MSMQLVPYGWFFKGPAALYAFITMPEDKAFVLASSNARGGVPSVKTRFPFPNRIG